RLADALLHVVDLRGVVLLGLAGVGEALRLQREQYLAGRDRRLGLLGLKAARDAVVLGSDPAFADAAVAHAWAAAFAELCDELLVELLIVFERDAVFAFLTIKLGLLVRLFGHLERLQGFLQLLEIAS